MAENKSLTSALKEFTEKLKVASDDAKLKAMRELDTGSTIDTFIKKYRSLDDDTKAEVSKRLRDDYFNELFNPEIQHPEIQNPQITPDQDTGNSDKSQGKPGFADMFREMMEEAKRKYEEENPVYEYTYKPGDTFGRVLMKMGLSDGRNLWGPDGDVEYYSKQLRDQGISGNIPIGTTIKLRKRK